MDAIQEYQNIIKLRRQAEIEAERAKTLAKAYAEDINKILAEEGVSSIQELAEKLAKETAELNAQKELYMKDIEAWNAAKEKLAAAGVYNG